MKTSSHNPNSRCPVVWLWRRIGAATVAMGNDWAGAGAPVASISAGRIRQIIIRED
jgi:hypothetical protein